MNILFFNEFLGFFCEKSLFSFKRFKLMSRFLFLIFLMFLSKTTNAQVKSKAFDSLLNVMVTKSVPTVGCEDIKKMKSVVLLDTREKREYEVSHLKDAHWVGFENFNLKSVAAIPKDANIVVYCSIGVRSGKIGEKLMQAGFTNVHNFYGSIFEWVNQGNPVYDMTGKPTNKIHGYNWKWGVWCNKGEKVYE
jgi:rhodanese-related sulfurtransferase